MSEFNLYQLSADNIKDIVHNRISGQAKSTIYSFHHTPNLIKVVCTYYDTPAVYLNIWKDSGSIGTWNGDVIQLEITEHRDLVDVNGQFHDNASIDMFLKKIKIDRL